MNEFISMIISQINKKFHHFFINLFWFLPHFIIWHILWDYTFYNLRSWQSVRQLIELLKNSNVSLLLRYYREEYQQFRYIFVVVGTYCEISCVFHKELILFANIWVNHWVKLHFIFFIHEVGIIFLNFSQSLNIDQ